jgi:hypothetical protein
LIHLSFTIIDAHRSGMKVDGGPDERIRFPHPQPTASHQEKHRAIAQRVNDLEQPNRIGVCHRSGALTPDVDAD